MEADDRFVAPVGAGRLYLLLAAEPFEYQFEFAPADLRHQLHQRAERELGPDHRCLLQHPPLDGREALDTGGEQRLDRRRDIHGIEVDGQLPPVVALAR